MMLLLPRELREAIAEIDSDICYLIWRHDSAVAAAFDPRRFRELFITRCTEIITMAAWKGALPESAAVTLMFGRLQSIDDQPSAVTASQKNWHHRGEIHRVGAAAVTVDGQVEMWFLDGQLHRVGGPAATSGYGRQWYQHGEPFREDDLPTNELSNGDLTWQNNKGLHRVGGPAWIAANGEQEFWQNGRPVI